MGFQVGESDGPLDPGGWVTLGPIVHDFLVDRRQQDIAVRAELRPTLPRQLWFVVPKSGGEGGAAICSSFVHRPATTITHACAGAGRTPFPCCQRGGRQLRAGWEKNGAYRGHPGSPVRTQRQWGSRRPGSDLGDGSYQEGVDLRLTKTGENRAFRVGNLVVDTSPQHPKRNWRAVRPRFPGEWIWPETTKRIGAP